MDIKKFKQEIKNEKLEIPKMSEEVKSESKEIVSKGPCLFFEAPFFSDSPMRSFSF